MSVGPLVRALFSFRALVGRVLGWDRAVDSNQEHSYLHRLSAEQRTRSLVTPGTPDGPFRLLYVFENELLGEVRNAAVHAFSCMALHPAPQGYRLYWAVYVKPVSILTPFYMGLIEPFRRFIVYPTILRRLRASWAEHYGGAEEAPRDGSIAGR